MRRIDQRRHGQIKPGRGEVHGRHAARLVPPIVWSQPCDGVNAN
jgi:hypothetical protein